eukprot:2592293-Amphidinium_carterae.1
MLGATTATGATVRQGRWVAQGRLVLQSACCRTDILRSHWAGVARTLVLIGAMSAAAPVVTFFAMPWLVRSIAPSVIALPWFPVVGTGRMLAAIGATVALASTAASLAHWWGAAHAMAVKVFLSVSSVRMAVLWSHPLPRTWRSHS